MKRKLFFCGIVSIPLLISAVNAQPPDTLWTKTFGGTSWDGGDCVQQTTDGGYIITGSTFSYGAGNHDVYLIKTDSLGNEVWWQTFGGSDWDAGRSVQQTTDGGYIIAGETDSFSWIVDGYLIKTDGQGNEIWSRTFGGSLQDYGRSVQQTTDGGYIIAGETSSYGTGWADVYLIKTDSLGIELWSQTFGGSEGDAGYSAQQTADGGYIVVGHYSAGGVYLVKTDEQGNEIWSQTFGEGTGYDVQQTADGGYIIAGTIAEIGSAGCDVCLIKTDEQGNIIWSQTFGGTNWEVGYSVQQTTDGGYVIAGDTHPFLSGNYEVYVIRTNPQGYSLWQQTFGGNWEDYGRSVEQTTDGGYIVAGGTTSYTTVMDVYLIRFEADVPPPEITITLTPLNPPIVIPASGGSFDFNASITSNETNPQTFDVWIMVQLPNQSWYGPVLGPLNLTLSAGGSVARLRTQNVPANAPAGEYWYEARVGDHPTAIWDTSGFAFTKSVGGDGIPVGDWACTGESPDWEAAVTASAPQSFALKGAHPNPFNPTTTIGFALPEDAKVKLAIYDIAGRLVATLVDGWRDAGNHQVTFDGSALSSGMYFYKFTAGQYEASGKMVLMK